MFNNINNNFCLNKFNNYNFNNYRINELKSGNSLLNKPREFSENLLKNVNKISENQSKNMNSLESNSNNNIPNNFIFPGIESNFFSNNGSINNFINAKTKNYDKISFQNESINNYSINGCNLFNYNN